MRPEERPIAHRLMNVEAEQQVLGHLLLNETRLDGLGAMASPELFADPVHGRIFDQIAQRHRAGEFVSPVTLRLWAEGDDGMMQLGGPAYLVRLAGCAMAGFAFGDYVAMLDRLRQKRVLAAAAERALAELQDDASDAGMVSGRLEAAIAMGRGGAADNLPLSATAATTAALARVKAAQDGERVPGVRCGIPDLDDIVPVLRPSQLILLGGRPSMGKSAVALEIAANVAAAGGPVCFASLEMQPDDMMMRLMARGTGDRGRGVPYAAFETGSLREDQYRAVVSAGIDAARLPIEFLPPSYRDVGALFAGAKQVAAKHGSLGLVVVDYLQLLRSPAKSRYEQITDISMSLKLLAMQLKVPVLALTQLSRQCEARDDKRPQMQDLRDSGQLEQDADTVMFCFREEYYLEREEPRLDGTAEASAKHQSWSGAMEAQRNRLEIIVAKQRQGRIGTAHLRFNPALNMFWRSE